MEDIKKQRKNPVQALLDEGLALIVKLADSIEEENGDLNYDRE